MGLCKRLFIYIHVLVWCVDIRDMFICPEWHLMLTLSTVGMTFLVGIPNYKATLTFTFTKGSVYTDTRMQTNAPAHTQRSAQILTLVSFLFYSSVSQKTNSWPGGTAAWRDEQTCPHTLTLISGSLRLRKDRRCPLLPRKRPRCLGSGCVVIHPMILCDSMKRSDQSVEQLHTSHYSSWVGDMDSMFWCETESFISAFYISF